MKDGHMYICVPNMEGGLLYTLSVRNFQILLSLKDRKSKLKWIIIISIILYFPVGQIFTTMKRLLGASPLGSCSAYGLGRLCGVRRDWDEVVILPHNS